MTKQPTQRGRAVEVNFDGLVGPTHNYSGLSYGNVASSTHGREVSNPREAALQGLAKMKALSDRGFPQAVLPPQERPNIALLKRLGYTGSDAEILRQAALDSPVLLGSVSSASSMWTANAATVSPSADTTDARVHFTPANLTAKFHRSFEHETTGRVLRKIFADARCFRHHAPLPSATQFGDEGAANHMRLCPSHGMPGVEVFVYGRAAFDETTPRPTRYPARQTREACEAIVRLHQLPPERALLVQQNPAVIDQGVFHNDVIAVANEDVLFHHEEAFLDSERVLGEMQSRLARQGGTLRRVCVPGEAVSVRDAVESYLFNSQLLSRADGHMLLVVPGECEKHPRVRDYLDRLVAEAGPIAEVLVMDLKQSMQNGGGPACLRLRVVLTPEELKAVHPGVRFSEALYTELTGWVDRHYRDRVALEDLADPALLRETQTALDELTRILGLGSIYPFQGAGL